jgi:hypothetical protein
MFKVRHGFLAFVLLTKGKTDVNYQHTQILGMYKHAMKRQVTLLTLALIVFMCWGCGTIPQATIDLGEEIPQAPDYQKASSWVFQTPTPDKPVDVFYVYPTIYGGDSPANMDISNADLRGIVEHRIDIQASVYSDCANIFAPYYRQMSITQLKPGEDTYQNQYFKVAYSDVSRSVEMS